MPSLPDLPGKGLVAGTTRRAKVVAAGAGAGALALGGAVVRKALRQRDGGDAGGEASPDPIAESPSAPPGAGERETPKPKPPAKPKPAAKPKTATKPKAASKPKAAKPKAKPAAAKPKAGGKAAAAEPPTTTGTDAPPKPEVEPGNISRDKEPHHALNNPVADPDETEYPDPYETREDPRDPVDPDGEPFGEEPHPATGARSTSEPPLSEDLEVGDRAEPPERDNLDG